MASSSPIGLDIGSMSVRAAQTATGKGGPIITKFGHALLPPGAVVGGVVHDERAVIQALKGLWQVAKLRGRQVALGVTSAQVVVREMALSNLPHKELRRSLPFQVRDLLPLPVERSLLDFVPLENPGAKESVRGLLIAAPKDSVIGMIHAVEKAGLHVVRVDLASFALLRAASRLDAMVEAIVDIGAGTTTVVVHSDGLPLFVRTVPRGGANITELIANRLGISMADAEVAKCRTGLYGTEAPQVAELVGEAMRPIVAEIRSSFTYLTTGERTTLVNRLALSGGGAQLPGLAELLRTELGVEVVAADPAVRLRDGRGKAGERHDLFRSSAAVSVGLTLGAHR